MDINDPPRHRVVEAHGQQVSSRGKTLEEYCYEFLGEPELTRINEDQVFSRYFRTKLLEDQSNSKVDRQQGPNTMVGKVDNMLVVSWF